MSASPTVSRRGHSTSSPEERGVQGLRRHSEWPRVADTAIEAALFAAAELVEVSQALVAAAFEEVRQAGLAAMDALHVAAAKRASVDEFSTVERPPRPVFRVTGLMVRTLESVG